MALDNAARNNVLDALNGVASFTAPTLPLKVRLMTANGTATSNGTELSTGSGSGTGSGYTAGGATVAFNAAGSDGQTEATTTVRWDNMPATTIVGAELWDSAGTPKRIQFGALVAPKTVASGDSFELPAADFTETLA